MNSQPFDQPFYRFAEKIDRTIRKSSNCELVIDDHYIVDVMFGENELDGIIPNGLMDKDGVEILSIITENDDGNHTDDDKSSDDSGDDVEVKISNFDGKTNTYKYKLEPEFKTNTVNMKLTNPS